ncbi:MAG TPA: hypothetical protein VM140_07760 [Burkholderiales bacterium]|nr:hypothetical protein [Burkholderiales bacterium]
MTITWVLNTIGLLATTVGALILFLHLHKTSALAAQGPSAESHAALVKDRRLLMIAVGLMAAWFVVQYLALLLT